MSSTIADPFSLCERGNAISIGQRAGWNFTPWLVVGKGPSFPAWTSAPEARLLALNHAITALPRAEIVHAVDWEVIEDCGLEIEARSRFLLMPWQPNLSFRPGSRTLLQLAELSPLLSRLAAQGRLLWYHRAGSPRKPAEVPAIPVRYFSAEGAFGLLALLGVKVLFSAGIDGGTEYASPFQQLPPLQNGQPTFNAQFPILQQIVARHGISWTRLTLPEQDSGAERI